MNSVEFRSFRVGFSVSTETGGICAGSQGLRWRISVWTKVQRCFLVLYVIFPKKTWYSRIAGWFLSNRNLPSWKRTSPFFRWEDDSPRYCGSHGTGQCQRKRSHWGAQENWAFEVQGLHVLVKFWFYIRYISKQKIYIYMYIQRICVYSGVRYKWMFMPRIFQHMLSIQNGAGFFGSNNSQIWARCF